MLDALLNIIKNRWHKTRSMPHQEVIANAEIPVQEAFRDIYHNNIWGGTESVSGPGSSLHKTEIIRRKLPKLFKKIEARSILDVPCGDFNWMKHVSLDISYIGADIVPEIILENNNSYLNPNRRFIVLDIIKDEIPSADIMLCRDCLVHFSYNDISYALNNITKSNIKYLLTTNFPRHKNKNISTGQWRPLNLEADPFNFPDPILTIKEGRTGRRSEYSDKSLALWRIKDIFSCLAGARPGQESLTRKQYL